MEDSERAFKDAIKKGYLEPVFIEGKVMYRLSAKGREIAEREEKIALIEMKSPFKKDSPLHKEYVQTRIDRMDAEQSIIEKRELDIRIAEDVLEFDKIPLGEERLIQEYSKNIHHAWDVVTALESRGLYFTLRKAGKDRKLWWATFDDDIGQTKGMSYHQEVAKAICLAALEVVGK